MNERIIAFVIILSIAAVGFYSLLQDFQKIKKKIVFVNEFGNKFSELIAEKGDFNYEIYSWLLQQSAKLQTEMGIFGIFPIYRLPYRQGVIQNYQVILNLIPEIRREMSSDNYRGVDTNR